MMSRRDALALTLVASGCATKRSSGFSGYAFVANYDGNSIAAVDLNAFALIRHIRVDGKPSQIATRSGIPAVYALAADNGTVYEIGADRLELRRKVARGSQAVAMRLNRGQLVVLYRTPAKLVSFRAATLELEWELALSGTPYDFDLSADGHSAVVSYGNQGRFALIDIATRKTRMITTDSEIGAVRFQSDGRAVIVADTGRRMLLIEDVASGRLVTRLPLAVRPDNFCFNADGGQLFVTGEGLDAVVVVYPYHTPQVAETVLAGRGPAAMAASNTVPPYLFVTNPSAGEVTILNITNRRVTAVAAVGASPGYVVLTPDQQFALVLNQKSGDMGVLRIHSDMANRARTAALFTMIPVGTTPVAAAVWHA